MHPEAMTHARLFFETYLAGTHNPTVVEIGSQNVNGSLREVAPANCTYVGVDFVPGNGVDIVLQDPYKLPFEDNYADAIVTARALNTASFSGLRFWRQCESSNRMG